MSDVVAEVSEKMAGAPSELVVRSAQARAEAQGVSVDEVLAAWAGEGALGAAPAAPAPATDPAPPAPADPAPADPAVSSPPQEAEPPPPAAASPSIAATAVAVAPTVLEEPDEVEPGDLGERLRGAAKTGALVGSGLGLFGVVISAPLLASRLATLGDPAGPAIEVTPLAATLTVGVASAVFGAVVAAIARAAGGFASPGHALRGRPAVTAGMGGLLGFVLGVIGMGILTAVNAEGIDGTTLLSVRSSLLAMILGGAALGAITAAVTQALGQPRALAELEDSSEEVRRRISNAVFIPILAGLVVVLFVIPLGSVLVRYPSFASIIAILVAGLILTFSSLMASRPNLRVTRGEVLTAIAGVGIVIMLLALIAAQRGGGPEGEGEQEEEAASIVRLA